MPSRQTSDEYFALTSYPPSNGDDTESEGLLLYSNEVNEEIKHPPRQVSTGSTTIYDQLSTLLLFSAFLVSLLSFATTLYIHFARSRSPISTGSYASAYYDIDIEGLRKPSQYLGLERVDGSVDRLAQELAHNAAGNGAHGGTSSSSNESMTMNPPPSLPVGPGRATSTVRVNERFPNATFPRDGWVLLTNEDVSLMQFKIPHVPPSSLCTFHISFPTRRALIQQARLLTLEGPSTVSLILTIYDLKRAPSYDVVWATKPSRGSLMRKINVEFGMDLRTEAFDCGMWRVEEGEEDDGILTVEVGCEGTGCRIEYREEEGDPLLGVELIPVES